MVRRSRRVSGRRTRRHSRHSMKSRRVRRMRHTRGRGRSMKRGGMFGYANQGATTAAAAEAETAYNASLEGQYKEKMRQKWVNQNGTVRSMPGPNFGYDDEISYPTFDEWWYKRGQNLFNTGAR